jgi:hypothetical protein
VAQRTTPDAVRAVLQKDYNARERPSLSRQIQTSSVVVSRVVTCAAAKGVTLTAEETELIECWLAAHFYAVSDRPYASRSTLQASGSMDGKTAMNLDATLYGQQAKVVDASGCLAQIQAAATAPAGGAAEAGGFWAGKEKAEWEQADTEDLFV